MGGIGKKVTVGYKYYLGMHMILCHGPVDKVTRIEVDGKTAWSGNATGGPISINAPDLFGGESREGGVSGTVDIEMGGPLQGRNAYLQSRLGTDIPAYRGVLGVVLNQVYVGMNPYLKRWAFWVSRIHVRQDGIPQWYDEKSEINGDMNPAHIIRECLTDPDWGMGYPEADIDDASFRAAADQMYNEGMGMSLLWDRSVTLEEFIQEVLKHIDGSLFVDRTSGKFVLKLARGGYDVNSLLVLDESSVDKISDFKRNTVGELVNSVTVVYWDASTGKNNSVTVQDIALAAQQQATIGTTKQFLGFTNGTIATRVAARSLKALSVPLASGTIYANRKAASLNIGDVFVLTWPRYGISQLVMRVANVEMGALGSNVVKIQAVEDVFALSSAIYAPPPPSGWSDPNTPPAPCPYHCVIEAPFWELVQRMGETNARALPATAGFVVATGVRPSSDASNAKLYTGVTGVWEEAGTVDFCPTAILTAAVSSNATIFPIGTGVDLDVVQVGTYALIDSELVRIDAVSDTSLTVGRGVLDTVAKPHAVGARLFFADDFFESDTVEYATGEDADIRLLPSTGLGTLDLASAPTQSVTMVARQHKPYPPGRLRINNQAYPAVITGPLSLSWAHRDRLQQTATLISEEAGNIGPEPGTSYVLMLYDENNVLRKTLSDLSGTSYEWTTEEEDSGLMAIGDQVFSRNWDDGSIAGQSLYGTNNPSQIVVSQRLTLSSGPNTDAKVRFDDAPPLADFELTCTLFAPTNTTADMGIVYRTTYWGNANDTAAYYFGISTSSIVFGKGSNSSTSAWVQIQRTVLSTNPGSPRNVRIRVAGTRHQIWVDGVLQINLTDASYTGAGYFGARLFSGSGASGQIDDLAIYQVSSRLNGKIRLVLKSQRGDLESYQAHDYTVKRAGYGYCYGEYYGGV